MDERSGEKVVDLIRDLAGRKATGAWATQDALRLRVPVPNIGTAVAKRGLSTAQQEGLTVAERWPGPRGAGEGDVRAPIETLRRTLFGAMVITYAQGMHQLRAASREYAYGLHLDEVVRVWRGGCIIRASLLEDLHQACRRNPSLGNPLADEVLAEKVTATQDALRAVARHAARWGIPAPGLMAALAYYDAYRSARLPANLIQAQRDYFGAHGVELLGHEGTVHMH